MKQKGFSPLVILITILLLAGIGALIYKKYVYQKQLERAGGAEGFVRGEDYLREQLKREEAERAREIATWKTLVLGKLSFKIPSDWWSEGPATDKTGFVKGNWINVNPTSLPQDADVPPAFQIKEKRAILDEEKAAVTKDLADVKQTSITEFGVDGWIIEGTNATGIYEKVKVALFPFRDKVYSLEAIGSINDESRYFEEILSTFKFTK